MPACFCPPTSPFPIGSLVSHANIPPQSPYPSLSELGWSFSVLFWYSVHFKCNTFYSPKSTVTPPSKVSELCACSFGRSTRMDQHLGNICVGYVPSPGICTLTSQCEKPQVPLCETLRPLVGGRGFVSALSTSVVPSSVPRQGTFIYS